MRQRRKPHAATFERREHGPIEQETGRRRLERGGNRRNACPHVPQLERLRDVRVLDRFAVACEARANGVGCVREAQRDKARVAENTPNLGTQRTQREHIAVLQGWRKRPVLGAQAIVTRAEHDGIEVVHVIGRKRTMRGKPHFDG